MRRGDKEKKQEEFCRATGHRASVCEQHGVLHLTLLGYFLPKCCFDQDNITGNEMGSRRRERGGVNIGTQLTGCHFLASRHQDWRVVSWVEEWETQRVTQIGQTRQMFTHTHTHTWSGDILLLNKKQKVV